MNACLLDQVQFWTATIIVRGMLTSNTESFYSAGAAIGPLIIGWLTDNYVSCLQSYVVSPIITLSSLQFPLHTMQSLTSAFYFLMNCWFLSALVSTLEVRCIVQDNKLPVTDTFSNHQIIGFTVVLIHFEPQRRGQPLYKWRKQLNFYIVPNASGSFTVLCACLLPYWLVLLKKHFITIIICVVWWQCVS